MGEQQETVRAKRPVGVTLLCLTMYAAASLVVISSVATGDESIPSDISALITLYLVIMAWGLWKLYRWAWFATLIMFGLSIIYMLSYGQLLNYALFSVPVAVPIVFAALSLVYLLKGKVRTIYMNNGWLPGAQATGEA